MSEGTRFAVGGQQYRTHIIVRYESDDRHNRDHSPDSTFEASMQTGAALIRSLLQACEKAAGRSRPVERLPTLCVGTDRLLVTQMPYRHQDCKPKDRRWRKHKALGLQVYQKTDGAKPTAAAQPEVNIGAARPEVAVWDLSSLPMENLPLPKLSAGSKWTVLKIRNRTSPRYHAANQALDNAICNFLHHHSDSTVVLVSVNDLRAADLSVSHEVSWERTLQQIVILLDDQVNLEKTPDASADIPGRSLGFLATAKHILVSLAPDAAVLYSREPSSLPKLSGTIKQNETVSEAIGDDKSNQVTACGPARADNQEDEKEPGAGEAVLALREGESRAVLYYSPETIEGDLDRSVPGFMRCSDSILTCGLALSLAEGRPLAQGIIRGLKAARYLFLRGFEVDLEATEGEPSEVPSQPDQGESNQLTLAPAERGPSLKLPLRELGAILVEGDLEKLWQEQVSGKGQPASFKISEKFREVNERMAEWKDCGWVYQHHLPETLRQNIVRSAVENWQKAVEYSQKKEAPRNLPHYQATFWTLRGSSTGYANGQYVTEKDEKKLVLQLCKKYLTRGPGWLTEYRHRSDRNELQLTHLKYPVTQKKFSDEMEDPLPVFPALSLSSDLYFFDRREIEGVRLISGRIASYVDNAPPTAQPLCIAVFGPPGSGKSTAIKEILKKLRRPGLEFEVIPRNLSQIQDPAGLGECFSEIQDSALREKIPVMFFDEYDTRLDGQKLGWLPWFLEPMQDGQAKIGDRTRRLPKCILIFAGSLFATYEDFHLCFSKYDGVEESRRQAEAPDPDSEVRLARAERFLQREDWSKSKASDFKGRLVAPFEVFGVDPQTNQSSAYAVHSDPMGYLFRRAGVLRYSLKTRYPRLFDARGTLRIQDAVMNAFLQVDHYYHGARSIDKIVQQSDLAGANEYDVSCLPPSSVIRLHTDPVAFELLYQTFPGTPR